MEKRALGFLVSAFFACSLCCVVFVVFLGDAGGVWSAYVANLETKRALAQAQAYDAKAVMVVAEGDAAILKQAALSVAADRHLVTLYAMSSNVAVLAGVLLAGGVAGFLAGKRREVNHAG
jgi:LPXTG-motif cell wall-anchored protein